VANEPGYNDPFCIVGRYRLKRRRFSGSPKADRACAETQWESVTGAAHLTRPHSRSSEPGENRSLLRNYLQIVERLENRGNAASDSAMHAASE
jgi:hypothetical protein